MLVTFLVAVVGTGMTQPAPGAPGAPPPTTPAAGAGGSVRLIPRPFAVRYAWGDTARDPFLDAGRRGKDALLGNRPALAPAAAPLGYGIREFLDDLSTASGAEFKVQGVLPGGVGVSSVAVINGQSYAEGDLVPVRATTRDFETFAAIARAKGLAFERAGTPSVAANRAPAGPNNTAAPPPKPGQPTKTDVVVLLQMGRVLPPESGVTGGIELRVPGYPGRVAVVPYRFVPRLSRATPPAGSRP